MTTTEQTQLIESMRTEYRTLDDKALGRKIKVALVDTPSIYKPVSEQNAWARTIALLYVEYHARRGEMSEAFDFALEAADMVDA